MTETPRVLPEMPGLARRAGDALSDLLAGMRLTGVVLFRGEFREPWCVGAPDAQQLARMLPGRGERRIPFHVIGTGGCWIELPGRERRWLAEGDAVLLPGGSSHRLAGGDAVPEVPVGPLLPSPPWHDVPRVACGGPGRATTVVCGFLQCDELLFHPIGRHLPALLHVSPGAPGADPWLAGTIRRTVREVDAGGPGARTMLPRLTELMFVEILRKHMLDLRADEVGWFAAFADPVAGAALRLMHEEPMHPWSIELLARRVGSSRTVLGDRFKRLLDQPPMQYLSQWRLQLAAQQLKSTDVPVKTVADRSGYESEAAFSRAFKRQFELAPAEWRRRQRDEPARPTA